MFVDKPSEQDKKAVEFRVKYIGETEFLMLTHNKVYRVESVEKGWYRIIDDSGEAYLYPPHLFEML